MILVSQKVPKGKILPIYKMCSFGGPLGCSKNQEYLNTNPIFDPKVSLDGAY